MRLSALKGRVRDLKIIIPGEGDFLEEEVNVSYRPGELTLEVFDLVQDQIERGMEMEVVVTLLQPLLVSWDLEDDILDEEGNPTGETRQLGISPADIKKVPLSFLGLLMDKITDDAQPTPTSAGNSGDTTDHTDGSDPSQNGTSSLGYPNTSDVLPGTSSNSP